MGALLGQRCYGGVRLIVGLYYAIAVLFALTACAEAQLAAHVATLQEVDDGGYKVGTPYTVNGVRYEPRESFEHVEVGLASWYGPGFNGRRTANGEVFDENELTAAHRTLQLPSVVRVTNLSNGRAVVLRVNDRGPFKDDRIIDVSARAAELLGFRTQGVARVRVEVLTQESLAVATQAGRSGDRIVRARAESPVDRSLYYVQAGTFASYNRALDVQDRLSAIGPTDIAPVLLDGEPLNAVLVGPIASRAGAEEALTMVLAAGQSDAVITRN